MTTLPFVKRVRAWVEACFGIEFADSIQERTHRFLEESLELAQSCGCTQQEAHQLVDYVFSRDVGEVKQEMGGTMTTLNALAAALKLDPVELGEAELARCWTVIDKIRAKRANKPAFGPLPGRTPTVEEIQKAGERAMKKLREEGKLPVLRSTEDHIEWIERNKPR